MGERREKGSDCCPVLVRETTSTYAKEWLGRRMDARFSPTSERGINSSWKGERDMDTIYNSRALSPSPPVRSPPRPSNQSKRGMDGCNSHRYHTLKLGRGPFSLASPPIPTISSSSTDHGARNEAIPCPRSRGVTTNEPTCRALPRPESAGLPLPQSCSSPAHRTQIARSPPSIYEKWVPGLLHGVPRSRLHPRKCRQGAEQNAGRDPNASGSGRNLSSAAGSPPDPGPRLGRRDGPPPPPGRRVAHGQRRGAREK